MEKFMNKTMNHGKKHDGRKHVEQHGKTETALNSQNLSLEAPP